MDETRVVIKTSLGDVTVALDAAKAPKTVENFLQYVDDKHYDGTVFHRVIDGFMVQGGGYDASDTKKPVRSPVQNEADNGLKNTRGTVAMARTSDPHSATSQFFFNVADNAFLDHKSKSGPDWGYAVFGKVVDGMDVVEKMKSVKTGPRGSFAKDAPLEPITIIEARRA
jgi:peptidyl-prolyl cis-trans isomerase B (cyclophilin B)